MSSFAPDGDAVRPDGTLKDASKIIWSYDADESIPFPLGSASGSHSGSHTPATNVAGVHRTTRISCPSQRYIEEAEPAPSASVRKFFGIKRKATSNLPDHGAARKKIADAVDDDAGGDASDNGTTTAPPTESVSDDYESLRAMADANNQVCSPHHSLSNHVIISISVGDLQIPGGAYCRRTHHFRPGQRICPSHHWEDIGRPLVHGLSVSIFLCLSLLYFTDLVHCFICRDDKAVKRTSCFLTGSTSSLRMHIAR
jgi:hypothetical protein